uniref:Uncharacterized protein n=1 Tax=Salix viminalis TaxID=40686 RepID=A0A6N2M3X4_SALVM
MENEMGQTNGGGDLSSLMMGVLKDGVIDIDGLAWNDRSFLTSVTLEPSRASTSHSKGWMPFIQMPDILDRH